MAAPLNLYLDCGNRKLVKSYTDAGAFSLPSFMQGETLPIRIYPVEATGTISSPFSYTDLHGGTVKLALCGGSGTPTGASDTIIAAQYTWSEITNGFSADLNMNTDEVTAFIGTASSKGSTLEIEYTPAAGSPIKYLQQSVTVKAAVIDVASVTPAPNPSYPTRAEVTAGFVKFIGLPGETVTLVSPDGSKAVIFGCRDDGTVQMDVIDPYVA